MLGPGTCMSISMTDQLHKYAYLGLEARHCISEQVKLRLLGLVRSHGGKVRDECVVLRRLAPVFYTTSFAT